MKLDYVSNEIARMRVKIRAREREIDMLRRAGAGAQRLNCSWSGCEPRPTACAATARRCASWPLTFPAALADFRPSGGRQDSSMDRRRRNSHRRTGRALPWSRRARAPSACRRAGKVSGSGGMPSASALSLPSASIILNRPGAQADSPAAAPLAQWAEALLRRLFLRRHVVLSSIISSLS